MKILAIDTSLIACSVALLVFDDDRCMHSESCHEIAPRSQSKLILPMIKKVLTSTWVAFDEVDAVAFGCGPASFTGVRIATSVAHAISFVNNIPIVPISSLAAMAQSAFLEHKWTKLMVAVDAQMNQIYWAIYELKGLQYTELVGEEQVCLPHHAKIPENIYLEGLDSTSKEINPWFAIGDGWNKYGDLLMSRIGFRPNISSILQLPRATAIAHLAKIKLDRGDNYKIEQAVPVYLS